MDKKLKVLMISDHLFSPSGVGHMSRLIAESLLKSGKFTIRQLGGAIKHTDYRPLKTKEYEDDLIVYPVDGYSTPETIRAILRAERPDIVWMMTDPRFFIWIWQMEDEIRSLCPIVYYSVWDECNPAPSFNRPYYLSNDKIVSISKVTDGITRQVVPEVDTEYLPHAVDPNIFKPLPEDIIQGFKKSTLKPASATEASEMAMKKTVFFFNGRNARRKQTGSMIFWFKTFLDRVGHDQACLLCHTDPKDENGPDLEAVIRELGLTNGEVLFSRDKVEPAALAMIYNMVDATILISNAEGFGIPIQESLCCGTPVICTRTGGMTEQAEGENGEQFGVVIDPVAWPIIGSQQVPFIREAEICEQDFVGALWSVHSMTRAQRKELGLKGAAHCHKNFNFGHFCQRWVEIMEEVHEKHGSWDTRKNYAAWSLTTI
jgi:glycosyltransferase involved in cell wall biosynthesis